RPLSGPRRHAGQRHHLPRRWPKSPSCIKTETGPPYGAGQIILRSAPTKEQARRSDRPMTACRCATASRLAAGPTINGMVRLVLLPHHEAVKPKEVAMPQRNVPRPAAVYGIDLGKNIFHVVALGSDGTVVQRVRFRRDTLLQFFQRAAPAIVG